MENWVAVEEHLGGVGSTRCFLTRELAYVFDLFIAYTCIGV